MVRLIVLSQSITELTPSMFQFQYGAIDSKSYRYILSIYVGFNSSMVRLIVMAAKLLKLLLKRFNSSMVRLIDRKPDQVIQPFELFQFQYGAIDRSLSDTSCNLNLTFQFQYGAIDSCEVIFLSVFILVSIPVWCD